MPQEFVEHLLQLSPAELREEPFGPLLLLVKLPARDAPEFSAALERASLLGEGAAGATAAGWATTELPTLHGERDEDLGPDQVGLLAELESSAHFALPLPPRAGLVRLGRSRSSAIVLRDDSVSQRHAQLSSQTEGVSLDDLSSKNGTWVNGVRLEPGTPRWLQPMDRLQFGRVQAFTCTAPVLKSVLRHRLRRLL